MTVNTGDIIEADDLMNAYGLQFKNTMNAFFNSDYDGWNAKLASVGTPQVKNLLFDTLQTDSADLKYNWVYDSTNDLYYTPDIDKTEYVIIEADDANITWTSNDTQLLQISSGKWLLYGDGGGDSDEVQRAKIIQSLFFGTDGTDQLVLDFTNITAIKSSHSNDVGKGGTYVNLPTASYTGANHSYGYYTGTFSDTSGNTDCSSWSNLYSSSTHGVSSWYIPAVTLRNQAQNTNSFEMGTDLTADENSNPADCLAQIYGARGPGHSSGQGKYIILHTGTISWVATTLNGSGSTISGFLPTDIDFFTDNSIPRFTAAGTLSAEGATSSTLIFKDTTLTVTNTISIWNAIIDPASTLVVSISYDGGTNYETITDAIIQRNSNTGTNVWLKLVNTRTDLTDIDKITEWATAYNWY